AAGAIVAFVDGHRVAGACELLGAGEARRARADDADAVPGREARGLGRDPALVECALRDRQLDLLDRDGVVVDGEDARLLTGSRTELAGELGEVVRAVEALRRAQP